MQISLVIPIVKDDVIDEEVSLGVAATLLQQSGHKVFLTSIKENNENINKIIEFYPQLVVIITYQDTLAYVEYLCHKMKERISGVDIVLVGYAATHYYSDLLKEGEPYDYAIIGEYEETLCELASALQNEIKIDQVKGLAYLEQDLVKVTSNRDTFTEMDMLPFADRSIMVEEKLNYATIQGSKGCKMSCCSFCCETGFWNRINFSWHCRSPRNIVDEIEMIVNRHNIYRFNFNDSNYSDPNLNSNRVMEIAELLISRNLPITYFVNIRADFHKYIAKNELKFMVKSGFRGGLIGFEAANVDDLKLYHKATTINDNLKAAQLFAEYDLPVECGFININPYSTLEKLKSNSEFLHRFSYMSYFTNLSKLKLFKGTRLYDVVKEDGLLIDIGSKELFNYTYKDQKMRILAHLLDSVFYPLNAEFHIVRQMRYFGVYFLQNVSHLINYFENVCNDKLALQLMLEIRNSIRAELLIFNDINYRWFIELIENIEKGYDEYSAINLSKELMGKDYMIGVLNKLNSIKLNGYKQLIKHNRQYADLL